MQLIKLILVCIFTFMLVFAGSITWATISASTVKPKPVPQYVPETVRWNKEIKKELADKQAKAKSTTKSTKGAVAK